MDLSLSLRLNAAFSFATGFILAVVPATVGSWLDLSIDGWLRVLGFSLIGHAGILLWASRHDAIAKWAKLNLALVSPYPLLMVAIVASGVVKPTMGQALLLADGVVVGLLAAAQWSGIRAKNTGALTVPA